jgi:S-adenosylmethionine hydrolase
MARRRIVTLLTDFGLREAYVSSMKGVLLSINPNLTIVDISHEVPKFDIRRAALVLAQAAPSFPPWTIHMAIVDPGVGTSRKPLILETNRFTFIGPDNGVLSIAAVRDGVLRAFRIEGDRYALPGQSSTFAGRDLFAPIAAHISRGVPPRRLGKGLRNFRRLSIPKPRRTHQGIRGEVLLIDSFGNLITNIDRSLLRGMRSKGIVTAEVGGKVLRLPFLNTYGEAPRGNPLALIGSSGLLEIGSNRCSMAERLQGAKEGSGLLIRF